MPPEDPRLTRARALAHQGQVSRAIEELTPLVAENPGDDGARFVLGWCLLRRGEASRALAELEAAHAGAPGEASRAMALADCLRLLTREGDARAVLTRAVEGGSEDPGVLSFLANLDAQGGRAGEAEARYRRILGRSPTHAPTLNALGVLLCAAGRTEEGLALLERAVGAAPGDVHQRARHCYHLNFSASVPPERVARAHRELGELARRVMPAHPAPHAARAIDGSDGPRRRLRVAYASADFRRHSVAYFIEGLLRAHDRAAFEVIAYHTSTHADDVTDRLSRLVDRWRVVAEPDAHALARATREHAVDILVDLGGLTGANRVLALAGRHAPVQVTYLGYPNTSGVPGVDYRVVDGDTDPPGSDALHTERLVRLARCFVCYGAPEHAPEPSMPGPGEPVTFVSFNNAPKMSPATVALWAGVLRAVPGSRLLVKGTRFGDAWFHEQFAGAFAAAGVARERLEFVGRIEDPRGHLAAYGRAHVALDTFPYHGTTTTCEALWMGVPVVTLAGGVHASRVGVSVLKAAGPEELVARDEREFVSIASSLARDRARLESWRAGLRDRVRASALMDATAHARAMEDAYRAMWAEKVGEHRRIAERGPYYS